MGKKENLLNNKLSHQIEPPLSSKDCFLRLNLSRLQAIEGILNRHEFSFSDFKYILDFGCRNGLKTRHFFDLSPDAKIYGCDIEQKQISISRKYMPQGQFIVNKSTPPLEFVDDKFDFVFSFSVFTHLSETNHIAWLKELSHKLKPGGVMVHTTHGYECLRRLRTFNPENLDKYEIPIELHKFCLEDIQYHYVIDDPNQPEYGYSIISKGYVLKNWERYTGMKLIDYVEGAVEVNPEGCHDLVILLNEI